MLNTSAKRGVTIAILVAISSIRLKVEAARETIRKSFSTLAARKILTSGGEKQEGPSSVRYRLLVFPKGDSHLRNKHQYNFPYIWNAPGFSVFLELELNPSAFDEDFCPFSLERALRNGKDRDVYNQVEWAWVELGGAD